MAGSEPGAGETESFRVRVSLERFFGDERARCYVSVRGARRVRWLARRLRRLFPLPRRLALLSRGHLLPPDETLALLRPDDPIEVIPATVEVNQLEENKHMVTGDRIETSKLEHMESSPVTKRRRKEICQSDNKDPVVTGITGTLPKYTVNDYSPAQKSIELTQEPVSSVESSSGNNRRQNNKQHFHNEANSRQPGATDTEMAQLAPSEDILQEQGGIEVPPESELSDSERMKLMKEHALAVLDQVEMRPRRRVRVRRRRKRPERDWTILDTQHAPDNVPVRHEATDVPDVPVTPVTPDASDVPDVPVTPDASDVPDVPAMLDASDTPYLPDAAYEPDPRDLVFIADPNMSIETVSKLQRSDADPPSDDKVDAARPQTQTQTQSQSQSQAQAVLRNAAAAPRAARLVRCVP